MNLGSAIVRATEAAIALAVVVLLVCFVKFNWMADFTDHFTSQWVTKTEPLFEADWLDYVVPDNHVPDRLDPIVGPYPEPPERGPSPEPKH